MGFSKYQMHRGYAYHDDFVRQPVALRRSDEKLNNAISNLILPPPELNGVVKFRHHQRGSEIG